MGDGLDDGAGVGVGVDVGAGVLLGTCVGEAVGVLPMLGQGWVWVTGSPALWRSILSASTALTEPSQSTSPNTLDWVAPAVLVSSSPSTATTPITEASFMVYLPSIDGGSLPRCQTWPTIRSSSIVTSNSIRGRCCNRDERAASNPCAEYPSRHEPRRPRPFYVGMVLPRSSD